MNQYLNLLRLIQTKGTNKPAARQGMPGSRSMFGPQMSFDLSEGFPILTTKKVLWKGVVVELLWFLRGDTNIKYLVDKGVNIWNEDAYNYYLKKCKQDNREDIGIMSYEDFIQLIKDGTLNSTIPNYKVGDCGYQYGKVWRDWEGETTYTLEGKDVCGLEKRIDQIANLIKGLKTTPESRRHILTAVDPAHDTDLALYWCHCLAQFNCRPIKDIREFATVDEETGDAYTHADTPRYYLDCQLYQRSCDFFLGGPYNIASYALLTHILAKICNMQVGQLIMSYGEVHIYDNHQDAVNEQLQRTPSALPRLELADNVDWTDIDSMLNSCLISDFVLQGYDPQPAIKAELSTGMRNTDNHGTKV